MKKIFIGGISRNTTEASLREYFADYGPINSCKVIMDAMTGQPRGFAFLELDDSAMADKAIANLDGQSLDGKMLKVNEARPRTEGGGFGGGSRGGYRGGNGSGGGEGFRGDRGGSSDRRNNW